MKSQSNILGYVAKSEGRRPLRMIDLTRRKFIRGLGLIGIAPAIVKASSIMRIHEPKDWWAGKYIPAHLLEPYDPMNGYRIHIAIKDWRIGTAYEPPLIKTILPAMSWRQLG